MHNYVNRYVKKNIAATSTGSTLLFTSENGTQRFYPTSVTIEVVTANAIIVVPTLSVGTNSSTYNNILAASPITGLTTVNKVLTFALAALVMDSIAANTGVYCNITVGATATAMTINVAVHGYYD